MYVTTGLWPQADHPTWEQVESLLRALPDVSPDDNFLVYTASDEPLCYLQAFPKLELWHLEYRDGQAKRHWERQDVSLWETLAIFKSYHLQDEAWRSMGRWSDISHDFEM